MILRGPAYGQSYNDHLQTAPACHRTIESVDVLRTDADVSYWHCADLPQDPRRQTLIANVLQDFQRLSGHNEPDGRK